MFPGEAHKFWQPRHIALMQERLGVDESKILINIDHFGNTTAATIPLGLMDALEQKRLRKGDLVLLISVLEHLWEPLPVLEQCRRVLRPGGLLFGAMSLSSGFPYLVYYMCPMGRTLGLELCWLTVRWVGQETATVSDGSDKACPKI